jgi:hypothetical protein
MPLLRQLIANGFSKDDDVYEKLPPELVSLYHSSIIHQTSFINLTSLIIHFVRPMHASPRMAL